MEKDEHKITLNDLVKPDVNINDVVTDKFFDQFNNDPEKWKEWSLKFLAFQKAVWQRD